MRSRLSGGGALPPKADAIQKLKGFVGGTAGILVLSLLADYSGIPWLMAPFGATCVLLFAVPHFAASATEKHRTRPLHFGRRGTIRSVCVR